MPDANTYAYVIERADDGHYWGYVPDLPGCTTTAETVDAAERQLAEAVALYLDYYRDRGQPAPTPQAKTGTLTAA